MDLMDSVVYKVCPFLAAGLLACSIYWSAMSYGALTVLQVGVITMCYINKKNISYGYSYFIIKVMYEQQ